MKTKQSLKFLLILAFCFVASVLAFWTGEKFSHGKQVVKELRTRGRFDQIRAMLLLYHEEYGTFPPTKFQTKVGGPMHSWRVLLMPFTDRDFRERYSKYNFSKPWNSPENLKALGSEPFSYFTNNDDETTTNFLAIGKNDNWPSKKAYKSFRVEKGKDKFLLLEDSDSKIHWMEPKY